MANLHCTVLFADIQGSTEFGASLGVAIYNEMLRDFHRTMHQAIQGFRERHDLSPDRLVASARGDECCAFIKGGTEEADAVLAMELAVYLKESWKASEFCREAAKTRLIPQVDLRIGIGCGEVAMDYDVWTREDTLEGIIISEAKRIEGMAGEAASTDEADQAKRILIMVKEQVKESCEKAGLGITFGQKKLQRGKGFDSLPTYYCPVYPVLSYPAWEEIQRQVVPEPATAWEVFNRALALQNSGELDAAIAEYKKAIEIKPDYHEAWYNMGNAYDDKKDYDEAIRCYLKAIEIKPDKDEAWNNMGLAYARKPQPDYDEAIRCFSKAIEIKPDDHEAWNNLGNAYYNKPQPDYDEAIRCYLKAIELKPDYEKAWYNMGLAYALKPEPDYDEAIRCYLRAIEIKPDYEKAWNNLGNAYYNKPQPDYDEAIRCYLKAIEIKPDYHEAWYNMGFAYYSKPQPDYDEAIRCYLRAIEIKPDLHEAWNNLGNAYYNKPQPDYDEAIGCFAKAIQIKPDKHEAWNNMGNAYALKPEPDYDEAIRCYLRAIEIKPDYEKAWYNLACAYALKGDVNTAVEHLARAIALRPENRADAREDTDFDGIREEPAFKALMAG